MPTHHVKDKNRIIVEFGTGDININTATQPNGDQFVILIDQPAQEIGTESKTFKTGDECDNYAVGLFFTNPKSLLSLILVLIKHGIEKFGPICQKCGDQMTGHEDDSDTLCRFCVTCVSFDESETINAEGAK